MSYEEEEVTCEEEDTHTRAVTFENVWGAPSHNNAQKSWPDYYRDPCICNRWPFSSARGSGASVSTSAEVVFNIGNTHTHTHTHTQYWKHTHTHTHTQYWKHTHTHYI
jgi:hypothetical protein